jgi:hypothetical protein
MVKSADCLVDTVVALQAYAQVIPGSEILWGFGQNSSVGSDGVFQQSGLLQGISIVQSKVLIISPGDEHSGSPHLPACSDRFKRHSFSPSM